MAGLFEQVTGARAGRRDLGDRGILRVTGEDRVRFLNAMLTNDMAALGPGSTCPAALLDRKGHLLADLQVLSLEGALVLDTAPGTAPEVAGVLDRHLVADEVSIEDLGGSWTHQAFEGPGVASLLDGQGLPRVEPGRVELVEREGGTLLCVGGGSLGGEGLQLLGPAPLVEAVAAGSGLAELPEEQVEVLRIQAFLPRYGIDMTSRNFPPEARLERAVSYTKGCYMGQEVVERIRSRGAVKRLLCRIRPEAPVARGDPLRSGERLVGEITSAAFSEATGPVALGWVRAEHAGPGTALDAGGVPAMVTGPEAGDPA